jgi:hypothetical protein
MGWRRDHQAVARPPHRHAVHRYPYAGRRQGHRQRLLGKFDRAASHVHVVLSCARFRTGKSGLEVDGGTPVLLKDIARVELGPDERRGIAELALPCSAFAGSRRGHRRDQEERQHGVPEKLPLMNTQFYIG